MKAKEDLEKSRRGRGEGRRMDVGSAAGDGPEPSPMTWCGSSPVFTREPRGTSPISHVLRGNNSVIYAFPNPAFRERLDLDRKYLAQTGNVTLTDIDILPIILLGHTLCFCIYNFNIQFGIFALRKSDRLMFIPQRKASWY